MSKKSKRYEKVKAYFEAGLWTAEMVNNAVGKWITKAEAEAILAEE